MSNKSLPPSASAFWSLSPSDLLTQLQTTALGLTQAEAQNRLAGSAALAKPHPLLKMLVLLLSQFKSPVILILISAALLSVFLKDVVDAGIILLIVLVSGLLGFWQERGAAGAVEKLLAAVQIKATCQRGGKPVEVHTDEVVPGDIVMLRAGDIVPADCFLLESKDLFVNEAALTGETFPAEKSAETLPAETLTAETPLAKRTNSLFFGISVASGTAQAVAVLTGKGTEFGKVSQTLTRKPPRQSLNTAFGSLGIC